MDLASLCRLAMTTGASDIHLKVGAPPMLRIDGEIRAVQDLPPLGHDELAKAMWDIMSPVQRERFKTTNDCDLAHSVPGVARFRCNVFRTQQKIGAIRIADAAGVACQPHALDRRQHRQRGWS